MRGEVLVGERLHMPHQLSFTFVERSLVPKEGETNGLRGDVRAVLYAPSPKALAGNPKLSAHIDGRRGPLFKDDRGLGQIVADWIETNRFDILSDEEGVCEMAMPAKNCLNTHGLAQVIKNDGAAKMGNIIEYDAIYIIRR